MFMKKSGDIIDWPDTRVVARASLINAHLAECNKIREQSVLIRLSQPIKHNSFVGIGPYTMSFADAGLADV